MTTLTYVCLDIMLIPYAFNIKFPSRVAIQEEGEIRAKHGKQFLKRNYLSVKPFTKIDDLADHKIFLAS